MLHFGTNANNTLLIKVPRGVFANIWNFAGKFFFTALGVSNLLFKFSDVDRCINIILYNLFTDDNCILKVVTSPRHKCNDEVSAQCQLAFLCGTAICNRVTLFHFISNIHNRALIYSGILVTSFKFLKLVRLYTAIKIAIFFKLSPYVANSDFITTYKDNLTISFGAYYRPGVFSGSLLQAGTNDRRIRSKKWYSLTLHVRSHKCTVCIIVLYKWNKSSSKRCNLICRNIHILNLIRLCQSNITFTKTRENRIILKISAVGQRSIRLSNNSFIFLLSSKIFNIICYRTFLYLSVRCFYKAEIINLGVNTQRGNQTNVWTFRGFNRAETTIVRIMNVTILKTGSFTRKTTRSQCRHTPFVGQLSNRVGLIHKLRQLICTKEAVNHA